MPRDRTVWLIESATRGTFKEWRESPKNWRDQVPRFSTVGSRLDAKLFNDEASARKELTMVLPHAKNCYVLELGPQYAQIKHDLSDFIEVDERAFTRFLYQRQLSGKGERILDGGVAWSMDRKIVAIEIFNRADKRERRYLRKPAT
jgi:hypothetical protein